MKTLEPGEWLDDVIVDFSMMLAKAENEADERVELLSTIDFSAHFDSTAANKQLINAAEHYQNLIGR